MKKQQEKLSEEKIRFYMEQAVGLSKYGMENNHGGPFGAIIIKDGQIAGQGFNQVVSANDSTAHAEIVAIRDACKNLETFDLSGCIIFASCEPCPMCLAAIYWANITEVYFANQSLDAEEIGFRDNFIYEDFLKPLEKRMVYTKRVFSPEAKRIFGDWLKKQDKISY